MVTNKESTLLEAGHEDSTTLNKRWVARSLVVKCLSIMEFKQIFSFKLLSTILSHIGYLYLGGRVISTSDQVRQILGVFFNRKLEINHPWDEP